jgi:replicative DNA helicase
MDAGAKISASPLMLDDCPGQTMLRISANARRMKQRHGIRLVIVDYLQLVTSENRRANRQEQVSETSRRLKLLARELNVPVIALAQVNRGAEDRTDKRPRLSDLRESGAIEQDADTVIFLHRPEIYEQGRSDGLVEVLVEKQRNGPTGEVRLMYVKQFMRFENMAS